MACCLSPIIDNMCIIVLVKLLLGMYNRHIGRAYTIKLTSATDAGVSTNTNRGCLRLAEKRQGVDIGRRLGFDFGPFKNALFGVTDREGGRARARFAGGGREQDCEKQSRRKKVKQWSYVIFF